MKKALLLLIFLCSLGFADIGGFENLKWGASREEAKDYLIKNFNLKESDIYERENSFKTKDGILKTYYSLHIISGKTWFSGIRLGDLDLRFNKYGEFGEWFATIYSVSESDVKTIKKKLKNIYNLEEKK